jgi:hypothetical protein
VARFCSFGNAEFAVEYVARLLKRYSITSDKDGAAALVSRLIYKNDYLTCGSAELKTGVA